MEAYTGESGWNSLWAPPPVMGTDAPSELALRSGPQTTVCRTASKRENFCVCAKCRDVRLPPVLGKAEVPG